MSAVLKPQALVRPHLARLTAGAIVLGLYGFAHQSSLDLPDETRLASQFHFAELPLPRVSGPAHRFIRTVNPAVERIAAWISTSGAAVALADLDGDGLANDVCYVETRTNQVIVGPVPGAPSRYQPFALDSAPLPYRPQAMAPMGCMPGDFNEDGAQDLLVYFFGRTPVLFTHRPDAGTRLSAAHYRPQELLPADRSAWYTIATTTADLDGDGHLDLVIGNYFADGLQLLDPQSRESAPGEGWMHQSFSRGGVNGGSQRLLLWKGIENGQVRFEEQKGVLEAIGAHRSWALAVAAADLNGDLLPELYVANDFGPDFLLRNDSTPGRLRFARLHGIKNLTTPNSKVLGNDSFKGMGAEMADLDGDGRLDILVSNITVNYGFHESNFAFLNRGEAGAMARGIAPFSDQSEALNLSRTGGWNWEVRLADFNNDATPEVLYAVGFVQGTVNRWPELQELAHINDTLTQNPRFWPRLKAGDGISNDQSNPFFVRAADGRYHDLSKAIGLGRPRVSRGIATADVDGDGRLDYAVADQWADSYFYHNQSPATGAFLGLHVLVGAADGPTRTRPGHPGADTPGRPAIGAEVSLTLPSGRRLVAQVDGGNGHSGKRSPELHFGLGQVAPDRPLAVRLRWRDRHGHPHSETLTLTPGWHTVLAGSTPQEK
jgi:hypothetical protein